MINRLAHAASKLLLPLMLLTAVVTGCDDDDGGGTGGAATPTASHSPTASPTTTPTEEPHGPPHTIMRVGSTQMNAGALTVDEIAIAYVVESACVGGSGDDCAGGVVLYTGTSPGFDDLEADDPSLPIYVLADDIEISIELISADEGASVLVSGVLLDTPGETAVVNSTGHLHNHPTWQIAAPGGEVPADRQMTFRLLAAGFAASDEITVTLSLYDGEGDGHEDHD